MDKNDVGAGYIALKAGDTVEEGDQRYVNFCWIPVPKSRIGAKIQRMHWPMRRKVEQSTARQLMEEVFGVPAAMLYGDNVSEPQEAPSPAPGSPEDLASLAELDALIPPVAKILDKVERDADFLRWVADRLVHVHKDPENVDFVLRLRELANQFPELPKPFTPNKYTRDLVALDGRKVPVDVYCVLAAFPTDNSAIDHAVKKQLAPGQRGQKDRLQDLKEARASLDRAIQMEGG